MMKSMWTKERNQQNIFNKQLDVVNDRGGDRPLEPLRSKKMLETVHEEVDKLIWFEEK